MNHMPHKRTGFTPPETGRYMLFVHTGTDYGKIGKYTGIGTFTVVDEADGEGASKWGLLKSYQSGRNGWVSLDYAKRV